MASSGLPLCARYGRKLSKRDFIVKSEDFSAKRKGKREYLHDSKTPDLVKNLNRYFQSKVRVPRMRMGMNQDLETLINEEALLWAMFLKNERPTWKPRVAELLN